MIILSSARSIDYVMHYTEWELVHLIKNLETDKTQTGKKLFYRMERMLDKSEE